MGNISHSLKKVLQRAQNKKHLEKYLKECLSPEAYKHIITVRTYKQRVFVYLSSSVALYELNLKKDKIRQCLSQKGLKVEALAFKVGA
jgi:hypothetical protein